MMKRWTTCSVVLIAALTIALPQEAGAALPPPLPPGTAVSNLLQPSQGEAGVSFNAGFLDGLIAGPVPTGAPATSGQDYAMAFTAGSSAYLGSVTLSLSGGPFQPAPISVNLLADNAGLPGAVMLALPGEPNPASGLHTYTPASPVALNAGSRYWVAASVSQNGFQDIDYRWHITTSNAFQGLPGWSLGTAAFRRASGGVYAPWRSDPGTFGLMGVNLTTVPEPATALVGLCGLAGVLGGTRRRATV